nr:MAG TPA_asm: hypothetical protein [Caudoviricetes sp.]
MGADSLFFYFFLTIYARKRILALKKERNEKWPQRITR